MHRELLIEVRKIKEGEGLGCGVQFGFWLF